MPPLELAALSVERHDRIGEKVGARPHAIVVVGTRIADRREQRAGVAIEREGHPYSATAMQGSARLFPSVRTSLIPGRGGVEAPRFGSIFGFERDDCTLDAPIAPGFADEDQPNPHHRCCADALADRPVGALPFPMDVPRSTIEREPA